MNSSDFYAMLARISQQIPYIQETVKIFGYFMGVLLFFLAILKLKVYGEARTAMSPGHANLKAPVIYLIVSAIFLNLNTAINALLSASFGYINPYSYPTSGASDLNSLGPILILVQLIGWISFIRGWMQVAHLGQQGGGQHGATGKAATHIIGGILAINIGGTIDLLRNTLFG